LVMAGQVRADGQVVPKPSSKVDVNSVLTIDRGPRFVSRGGEKLEAAFDFFDLDIREAICADVGASTGGFTDCLLQHGATRVYAIDVGKGILHWKLRNDPRVVVMEGANARYIDALPEKVAFVSIDASFISLKILLPVVKGWLPPVENGAENFKERGEVVALIKPQFEAGRVEVARGKGVVRDPEIHRRVLIDALSFTLAEGYGIRGLIRSPVLGPKGNIEFLGWFSFPGKGLSTELQIETLVEKIVEIQ